MVSVMAVKIQFSSPSGVLLSLSRPGILGDTCVSISDGGTATAADTGDRDRQPQLRQGGRPHGEEPLALPRLYLHSENSPRLPLSPCPRVNKIGFFTPQM